MQNHHHKHHGRRRSCLSSKKKDRKIKKKVRFAENVKDIEYVSSCGSETMDFNGATSLLVEFHAKMFFGSYSLILL